MFRTLIAAAELRQLMRSGAPLLVFDCSFDLMQPELGRSLYVQAHIPGALYADLNRDLSAKGAPDAASGGRHPLPAREHVAAWLGRMGLRPGMQAVVYDRNGQNFCVRLWWMLQWCGHQAAAVLDGGLATWQADGGSVASGPGNPVLAPNYPLAQSGRTLLAIEDVAARLDGQRLTLIDARAPARFRGEVEPLDPVAGHIPGALNRPFAQNLDANGKFKGAAQLRAEFESLLAGRDPAHVTHYCGSGVSALPNLLAMEIAGLGPGALFAGSWSQWCSDPARPVATGAGPD